jgi:hypothetical protein
MLLEVKDRLKFSMERNLSSLIEFVDSWIFYVMSGGRDFLQL